MIETIAGGDAIHSNSGWIGWVNWRERKIAPDHSARNALGLSGKQAVRDRVIGDVWIPHYGVIHVIIVAVPNDRILDVAIKLLTTIQRVWKRVIIWRRSWPDKCAIMMRVADVRETKLINWIEVLVPIVGGFCLVNPDQRWRSGYRSQNIADHIVIIAKMF